MSKAERQLMIKNMVMNDDIHTQEELLKRLNEEGFTTTQATISRDISELNLVKTSNGDRLSKYTIFQDPVSKPNSRIKSTVQSVVLSVTQVEFMNIVKTQPANAHVIGAMVDDLETEEIVGTVAGNDTILLISKTKEQAEHINHLINEYRKDEY